MIALLAAAGGVGAIARFMLDGMLRNRLRTVLPLGTIIINVSGSLLLGFLTGLVLFAGTPDGWRVVVGTGFLGGYTTFSTASVETARLVQERRWLLALINAFGMLVLAVLAAAAGVGFASLLH
ncbi:fluoride efflux transporter CrcB [Rathayibacter soli]|uniref:fluoride efflux transporter CrcB n=1 Tax=Rathayibacter soli TaxID=3144168 RepID=UPI0027E48158|nr:fluoride efflux transporter CrcB [Glaciibacter superstes]